MKCLLTAVLLVSVCAFAQDLTGVIDLHVHCDPDNSPRAMDAIDVAKLAKGRGLRALVLKNHNDSTAPLAFIVNKEVPGIQVFGGIALNRAVGGINPAAVAHMASLHGGWGRIVWMPTADAENQIRSNGGKGPFVKISENGQLLPQVKEVIALIAKNKLVLATGHSSAAEDLLLIREARRAGVDRIVVTHPMVPPVAMTIAQMKEAAESGAFLEFTYMQLLPKARATIQEYVKAIRAVGPEHCVISSDLGRVGHPSHPDGMQAFIKELLQEGLTTSDIDRMAKTNPAKILGL